MSSITPLLDTLLPQVLGRRAELQRFAGPRNQLPLAPLVAVAATRPDGFERKTPGQVSGDAGTGATATKTADTSGSTARAAPRQAAGLADYARPMNAGLEARTQSARPQLSREGGLIAGLLARDGAANARTASAALALFGAARVPPTPLLASVLGQQVAQSGVFYESHLARWFNGHYAGDKLREEPQNKPQTRDGERAAAPQLPRFMPAARAIARASFEMGSAAGDDRLAGHNAESDGLIDDRLLPVVRQQLDVLSSSLFRWQGQAWPGVDMQWQIHAADEDGAGEAPATDSASEQRFSTRLSLDLPRLGRLEIVLELADGRIDVYACAASESGSATLQPETAALEQRFEQAGFASAHVRLVEASRA